LSLKCVFLIALTVAGKNNSSKTAPSLVVRNAKRLLERRRQWKRFYYLF
jgi:hypothetical protein